MKIVLIIGSLVFVYRFSLFIFQILSSKRPVCVNGQVQRRREESPLLDCIRVAIFSFLFLRHIKSIKSPLVSALENHSFFVTRNSLSGWETQLRQRICPTDHDGKLWPWKMLWTQNFVQSNEYTFGHQLRIKLSTGLKSVNWRPWSFSLLSCQRANAYVSLTL